MHRRAFLGVVAASLSGLASFPVIGAANQPYGTFPLPLCLQRGNEQFNFDAATEQGYEKARYLLRDVSANIVGYPTMDLLHILSWMYMYLGREWSFRPIVAHSGLRTITTNARLESAARNSLHLPDTRMVFRAVDCHINGIPTSVLGDLAAYPQAGGVGVYPTHIHIDDGRTRRWTK